MEPNRMEEEFRKKLNAREIQPAEAAWDRLDAMLSVAENKKPRRSFRWLYVAAGLAVFFTVGLFLFTQETKNNEMLPTETGKDAMVTTESSDNEGTASEDLNRTPFEIQEDTKRDVVAENHPVVRKPTSKQVVLPSALPQYIVKDEIALVESLKILEAEKLTIDEEKLLITNDLPQKAAKVKVSANSLLSSVEGELNVEFRETTLDKIKKNFKTVKTAVANRNYE